jgi:hypothetical protein
VGVIRSRAAAAAIVSVCIAPSLAAAQIELRTISHDAPHACTGKVVASAECSGTGCPAPRPIPLAALPTTLTLPDPYAWSIALESANCWAAPVRIPPPPAPDAVELTLWPSATIGGPMTAIDGGAVPRTLRVEFTSPPDRPAMLQTVVTCPVSRGAWTCSVPATDLDLRVEAEGFVPVYLWNVRTSPGETKKLAATRLTRGASLAGWVDVPNGGVQDAEVELFATGAATEIPASDRFLTRSSISSVNERGFFQFSGTPPGSYSVTARKRGWSPARETDVRVDAGREHVLRQSLRLAPLASLAIIIQPPLSPDSAPWKITLSRPAPLSQSFAIVKQERASDSGYWSGNDLEADQYKLTILDSAGSVFATRDIEVAPPGSSEVVTIEKVAVIGQVMAGDVPLQARVTFIDGRLRVQMESGEEGSFGGVLPRPATWDVDVRPAGGANIHYKPVEISANDDGGPAEVKIVLPGGRVRGVVVDERGNPLSATVRVRTGASVKAYGSTDSDGKFAFMGLMPGLAGIEAEADPEGSALISHEITEETGEELKIVVPKRRAVTIRLVTPDGRAVSGAVVWQFLPPFRRRVEALSGPDGTVTLHAPTDGSIDAAIFAAGFPIKLVSLPRDVKSGISVAMQPVGGLLRFVTNGQAWPYIARDDGPFFPVAGLFFRPDPVGPPYGFTSAGFTPELEPGMYVICPGSRFSERCQRRALGPGTRTTVDMRPAPGTGE